MKSAILTASVVLVVLAVGSLSAQDNPAARKLAIKAGKIVTMTSGAEFATGKNIINNGVILVSGGKIEAIGPASSIAIAQGYTLIDASDRWATPGIVEAHTHVGTEGGFNDMVTPINPELRIDDCVNPEDVGIKAAVTGGVTTIHTMPGSGTNLAGFTVIIKLDTSSPEKMVLREIGAMKIAAGLQP